MDQISADNILYMEEYTKNTKDLLKEVYPGGADRIDGLQGVMLRRNERLVVFVEELLREVKKQRSQLESLGASNSGGGVSTDSPPSE